MALPSGIPARINPPVDGPQRPSVLLVDDDDAVRAVLGDFLAQCGYRVAAAANGVEALALASSLEGGIDLLITDLSMPGMTGIELACRFTAERPGAPILFLSGDVECISRVRAASIDARTEVLTKPLDFALLASYIDAAIPAREASRR